MGEILMINCFLQKLLQKIKVFIPILKLNRIILDSYKTVWIKKTLQVTRQKYRYMSKWAG